MDWWTPRTCNNRNSLENVPVVPYLCRTPSSLENKFNKTGPRKKVDDFKPKEINDPSDCNALVLPDYCSEERVRSLSPESFKICSPKRGLNENALCWCIYTKLVFYIFNYWDLIDFVDFARLYVWPIPLLEITYWL